MLVLHMVWLKERHSGAKPFLFVWAECSLRWQNSRDQQTPAAGKRMMIHPFAARSAQLTAAMMEIVGKDWNRICQAGDAVVFLPSQDVLPCSSPQLDVPQPEGEQIVVPWKIPGYFLAPAETAQFLQLLSDRLPHEHSEVVIAGDAAYWLKAFDFVQSLCRNGQFIPALTKGEYGTGEYGKQNWYTPVWQPYLAVAAESMAVLIKAMPDAACHATPSVYDAPKAVYPDKHLVLSSFIQVMVHAIVFRNLPTSTNKDLLAGGGVFSVWLAYLLNYSQAGMFLAEAEAGQLFHWLEQWQAAGGSVGDSIVGSYHCCLMLQDPKNADEPWNLHYLIYPADDPSLLLPAAEIWSGAGENFAYLQYRLPHLQHRLLSDLGYGARIFAPIATSLTEPCPVGCTLTVEEAYEFLGKAAGNLQKAGIRVIVPNWWGKEAAPLKVKLEVEDLPLGRSFVGVDALASYDVSLAIGEQPISRFELEQIAALKTPLVYVAGCWREVSPQQARAALAFFDKQGNEISFGGMLKWSASGEWDSEDEREENVIMSQVVPPERMTEIIHCLTTGIVPPVEAPPGFMGTLRHYQLHGLAWLAFLTRFGLGACLADDMGLGKTIQIIAYILCLKQQEPDACCLIICPTSVLYNWQREIAKFAPELRILVHYGPERLSGDRFAEQVLTKDVVLTTYGLANRDCDELSRSPWRCIIVDEAQNLKNPQAQQTVAVSKIPAVSKIALTGTPVENRLSELWSIMNWLNSGYLGTIDQFKQQYAVPIERGQNTARQQRLQQVIKPFILRRLKTDKTIAPDLPDKQESKVYCQLTKEQATLYQAVLDVMLPQIAAADPITRKALIGATLTKLKQICNHPAHFLKDGSALASRSNKLTRLTEMLAELQDEGRRALVFTQYTQMGILLQQHLRDVFGWSPLFFHGSLSRTERDKVITSFQSDEQSPPVLILSLKAGGVGLNLTKADTVFHYDRWWNPAVENQATDRAFRIGQTNNVQVYKFITAATLEEKIDDMIESKKSLAENIIGVSETWLGDLSAAELKSVLELHAAGLEE